ncbi:Outer membrane protein beta-barrel domain-containing protein [Chryseolinea serpens]|jgi:hypothetical protein|uniref:Outer membrane protein beta-barrel domain-containing protein n=1 Tax=Chryseolinea serpens TaxID=947013 RepID=A0A1M5P2Y5_9BACT|nr:porin family protein [Chryseolinea serpens]SHG95533.1 Outer membrane protein beta-barrel domain-containing protein [Chryseolinea serpens]
MNRFLSIACLVLPVWVANAQESDTTSPELPKTVFGIKGGVNVSSLSASINSESRAKPGLALGFYVKVPMSLGGFFRPELYYSNQGQKDNYVFPYGHGGPSIGSTTTSLHYINVPLLLEFGRKVSFQVGPQVGILLKGTEKGTVASVKVDDDLKDVMTKADVALVAGVGFSPGAHFNCGARYNYGISNIYKPADDGNSNNDLPTVQNRVFHFYVAYSF